MLFYPDVVGNYSFGAAEISFKEPSAVLVHLLQDSIDASILPMVVAVHH